MKRVMIIEDHADTLEMLNLIISGEGFDVVVADCIEEIQSKLAQEPLPDLILTDLSVPGVNCDGEIIDLIRKCCRGQNIPITVLSGNADVRELARKYQVGYLAKPFTVDDVTQLVNSF